MENSQIADIFDEIADLLELQEGDQFRIRAYRNAARTVRNSGDRLEDWVEQDNDLTDLPNIGQSIADKIKEVIETGTCSRLEQERKKMPEGLPELMTIPQIGPRTAMQLYKERGIDSIPALKKAAEKHELRALEGLGAKTEENILKGIALVESTSQRMLLLEAEKQVKTLSAYLNDLDSIDEFVVAGSFRRRCETVGDVDILVRANDRQKAARALETFDAVTEVLRTGEERVSVRMKNGPQVDFRFFDAESFGAALQYFTGSKEHNVALRKIVRGRRWKLNEYGLFKGDNRLAGKTEESVYHKLDMDWIPPELREDAGELQASTDGTLPSLIELTDIRGDLHAHTDATDGNNSLEDMVEAAKAKNYQYIAITNHSKAVHVAGGLDEKALEKHAKAIRALDEKTKDIWVLAGVEVDILKNGDLDLATDTLENLDWVVASVHSYFELPEDEMTERLIAAVQSGVVHCLGHPTGRMFGKRRPAPFDLEKVAKACQENNVCLEINAQPDRLDLPANFARRARDLGVSFSIATDAHQQSDFDLIQFGVDLARRAWLNKRDVINTKTARQLQTGLKKSFR